MNNSIASSASDSDGTRQLASPGTPIDSRLVVNSVNPAQAPSSATISAALASSRCSQLSSTTSSLTVGDETGQGVHGGAPRLIGQPQCAGHRDRHHVGIGDRRQIHMPHPIRKPAELAGQLGRDLHRQPGFAGTARAGQRHQPVVRQQLPHLAYLRVAAHEAGELRRKMLGRNGSANPQRRELVDQVGVT